MLNVVYICKKIIFDCILYGVCSVLQVLRTYLALNLLLNILKTSKNIDFLVVRFYRFL